MQSVSQQLQTHYAERDLLICLSAYIMNTIKSFKKKKKDGKGNGNDYKITDDF